MPPTKQPTKQPSVSAWSQMIPALAAAAAGAAAAWVLSDPPANSVHSGSSTEADSAPLLIAIAALFSVLVNSQLARHGTRPAWVCVLGGVAILLLLATADEGNLSSSFLAAARLAAALAAGTVLGAAAAAVRESRSGLAGLVGGVLSLAILGNHAARLWNPAQLGDETTPRHYADYLATGGSIAGAAPAWLLLTAAIGAALALRYAPRSTALTTRTDTTKALSFVAAFAIVNWLLTRWLEDLTGYSHLWMWTAVVASVLLILAVTVAGAWLMQHPGGVFLLSVTATVSASATLSNSDVALVGGTLLWSLLVVPVLALATGLYAGLRHNLVIPGLLVVAIVPTVGVAAWWWNGSGNGEGLLWLLAQMTVIAVGTGCALGSALPVSALPVSTGGPGIVAALTVPFTALLIGATTVFRGWTVYSGAYEPLPGVDTSSGWTSYLTPETGLTAIIDARGGSAIALLCVLVCLGAVLALRRREAHRI